MPAELPEGPGPALSPPPRDPTVPAEGPAPTNPGLRLGGLAHLSGSGVVATAVGLLLCIGVGDLVTGTDVNFELLYLIPIAFSTWLVSVRAGLGLAALAALVSMLADILARQGTRPHVLVLAWNMLVQLGIFSALVLLLDGLRTRLEGEQHLARTDALTGLSNRRAFFEACELELERARRHGRPITLAYMDCDDFKFVNDNLGHAAGDLLLMTVARTLRASTRAIDAVARLGGDEFGVLFPETDGPTAATLAARLHATILATMERHHWQVGFSVGVATFVAAPRSVDEMLGRADLLMYQAKRSTKGTVKLEVIGPPAPPSRAARVEDGTGL